MKKEFKFDTPELILIISNNKESNELEDVFQKCLDQTGSKYTVLPICIERKHIKKMLTAIKLMDVRGAYISESCRLDYRIFADTISAEKPINTIVLKKNKYQGHNTLETAYISQLGSMKNIKKSSISIVGYGDNLKTLTNVVKQIKPRELKIFKSKNQDRGSRIQHPVYSDINIICGPSTFKIPAGLNSKMKKDQLLIDMREGVQKYPKSLLSHGQRLIKNHRFLAHLTAASVKLWANKQIDIKKVESTLSRYRVK